MKHSILITLEIVMLILITFVFIYNNHLSRNMYNKGWNDAIDAVPKLIIFNPSWKTLNMKREDLLHDAEGNPAFVCKKPATSVEYGQGGDTMEISQIMPPKKR